MAKILGSYDYVTMGAGPAGLAFSASLQYESHLLVDQGVSLADRRRDHPQECVQGAGGAGLFSDGKFSFFPSGTRIWEQNRADLLDAYALLARELPDVPPFPDLSGEEFQAIRGQWTLKRYPSLYVSLADRIALIQRLVDRSPPILFSTKLVAYWRHGDGYCLQLDRAGEELWVLTKKLVLAGGRFMPLFVSSPSVFRRYEFGVRLHGPWQLLRRPDGLIDPKFLFEEGTVDYRTFCWCHRGEMVQTQFNGMRTYSGRADCDPTERSNFGFNVRVRDPDRLPIDQFGYVLQLPAFDFPLQTFRQRIGQIYPAAAGQLLIDGIDHLLRAMPELNHPEIACAGPTVEGVGVYPSVDAQFELQGQPGVFAIGDCSGLYRGIVASLLAGLILAVREKRNINTEKYDDNEPDSGRQGLQSDVPAYVGRG